MIPKFDIDIFKGIVPHFSINRDTIFGKQEKMKVSRIRKIDLRTIAPYIRNLCMYIKRRYNKFNIAKSKNKNINMKKVIKCNKKVCSFLRELEKFDKVLIKHLDNPSALRLHNEIEEVREISKQYYNEVKKLNIKNLNANNKVTNHNDKIRYSYW